MPKSWKDASRTAWETTGGNESGSDLSDARLQIGCLQRIADATESMARNYVQLQAERDRYERGWKEGRAENERLGRTIRALRGVITRQKRARHGEGE